MKSCPFCAEAIQDEAVKCKHCGEFLTSGGPMAGPGGARLPWYYRTPFLITAFLCVGPLALPLLWLRPRLSRQLKGLITIIVLLLTWWLARAMAEAITTLKHYYQLMGL